MVGPLFLLIPAALCATLVAYGTHPFWAQFWHGVDLIIWSRRLQWGLSALSLVLCLVLVGLVVAGKKRAWWLIGLGPILALFIHRFQTDPMHGFAVIDGPTFVTADQATFIGNEQYVVGLVWGNSAYAYPYSLLYRFPVIFQDDHEKRMVLIWSAYANRAIAFAVTRDWKARDTEIVSMPANALLIYNSRFGQFVNGVTGETPSGQKPKGFLTPIAVSKMPWRDWARAHPGTQVMYVPGAEKVKKPDAPLAPALPMKLTKEGPPPMSRVVLVGQRQPLALWPDAVTEEPLHLDIDGLPGVVFRDRSGQVRAYQRRIDDMLLRFRSAHDSTSAVLVDRESNTGWSGDGRAVSGSLAKEGKRLSPAPCDQDLSWAVVKFWMPGTQFKPLASGL